MQEISEDGINDRTTWVLNNLVGEDAAFDRTVKPGATVQGRCYLNMNYFVRNMGAVMPFDPASVGVPADQVTPAMLEGRPRIPAIRRMLIPWRFIRTYRWVSAHYRRGLSELVRRLDELYWQLREGAQDPLPLIWALFAPDLYQWTEDNSNAHFFSALTITSLDGVLRKQAPQLLGLLVGQKTATSLIGQRIWELSQVAETCGPQVRRMLEDGTTDLDAYRALPEAAPLVAGVAEFLRQYGHRGFRYETDWVTERLADHPDHVLLAVAGQLDEKEPPNVRADAAYHVAQEGLRRMNPLQRAVWKRVLRWGQQLISWREESKSAVALRMATHGLAARLLARVFYPDQPDDTLMFYTFDEFFAFVRSQGQQRVDQETLDQRRAQFELDSAQSPPELLWYDPATRLWRLAGEPHETSAAPTAAQLQGIAASAGSGPVEGIALVTNDPLEAGRRLLQLSGPVVLVTRMTDPAWSGLFRRLTAVVTELGGVISHAAIVARENGLPAIVGITGITQAVRNGQRLRVDGATGVVEILS
jgi:phosphohistidine swiveling domain-containing protein